MNKETMDIHQILEYLPHRFPFLLIDRVLDIEVGKSITALKNVSMNEPYFAGHFPERPLMPGVIILEAMAQAAGILVFRTQHDMDPSKHLYFFAGIDNARFKQMVSPGDQMILHVEIERGKRDVWKLIGEARVDDKVVCSAEIMLAGREIASQQIDERASVDASAKIGKDVTIGAWAVIGPDVEIGEGTWVAPHAVIKGPAKIGKFNKIYQFASVGEDTQDKKYKGEKTYLQIGDNNIFREFCTIHRASIENEATTIGDNNLFMAYTHIAHDCQIGNHTIFSNNASLAGHVIVEDYAILSGFSMVHQFCTIGKYSFVAAATPVGKDVLPFIIASGSGHDAAACGLNTEGLKRHGFTSDDMNHLKNAYKVIFRQGLTVPQAIEQLKPMVAECSHVQLLIDALTKSTRGIIR